MHTTCNSPIFVVGSARSGTTLLYSILLSSGEFAVYQAETLLLDVCKPKYGDLKNNKNYEIFINDWIRSKQFYRSALEPLEFVHGALDHHDTYTEFMRYFMECIAHKQGKKRWAEQTPGHVFHMELLTESFPDAKFIHVIRDGRDVAVSKRSLGWTGTKSRNSLKQLIFAAKSWEMSVRAGRKQGKRLGDNYVEIRYEDIVRNIDDVLLKLSKFTEIVIDQKTIASSTLGSLGKANTAYNYQASGLSSKSVERWKMELNQKEKDILHLAIGDSLRTLGYKLEPIQLNIPWAIKMYSKLYPSFFLNMKNYLKNRTSLGRLSSDTLEIGLR